MMPSHTCSFCTRTAKARHAANATLEGVALSATGILMGWLRIGFQEELLSERLHLVAHNAVVAVARLRVSRRRHPHNGIRCVPVSPCQAHHRSQYRGADGSSSQDEEANVEDVHQAVGRRHNTQSHEGNKAQLSCTHVQVILLIRQRLHWFRCPGCGARVGH